MSLAIAADVAVESDVEVLAGQVNDGVSSRPVTHREVNRRIIRG